MTPTLKNKTMKTKLLLLAMVFGFAVQGWGQTQEEIEINPFGKDKIVTKTEKGNTVKFKINNVNTFKINGFIESKPLSITFEVPEIFKNFIESKTEEQSGEQPSRMIKAYDVKIQETLAEIESANKSHNKELVNELLATLKNLTMNF